MGLVAPCTVLVAGLMIYLLSGCSSEPRASTLTRESQDTCANAFSLLLLDKYPENQDVDSLENYMMNMKIISKEFANLYGVAQLQRPQVLDPTRLGLLNLLTQFSDLYSARVDELKNGIPRVSTQGSLGTLKSTELITSAVNQLGELCNP